MQRGPFEPGSKAPRLVGRRGRAATPSRGQAWRRTRGSPRGSTRPAVRGAGRPKPVVRRTSPCPTGRWASPRCYEVLLATMCRWAGTRITTLAALVATNAATIRARGSWSGGSMGARGRRGWRWASRCPAHRRSRCGQRPNRQRVRNRQARDCDNGRADAMRGSGRPRCAGRPTGADATGPRFDGRDGALPW